MDKWKKQFYFALVFLIIAFSVVVFIVDTLRRNAEERIKEDDSPYFTVSIKPDDNSSGLIQVVNSSNMELFPQELYYRNGTIAGWLINGTFTKEFPFDMWIHFSWNDVFADYFCNLTEFEWSITRKEYC